MMVNKTTKMPEPAFSEPSPVPLSRRVIDYEVMLGRYPTLLALQGRSKKYIGITFEPDQVKDRLQCVGLHITRRYYGPINYGPMDTFD